MGALSPIVAVVAYHAIARPASRVAAPPDQLADELTALSDAGFTFVSLDAIADWIEGDGSLPPRAAAVTFDDGYASVLEEGLPILARLRAPATVFVVAGRLAGDNRWPGQGRAVPTMPLLDARGVRALAEAGVGIGSHSLSHPRLPELDAGALRAEIEGSADRLEQLLQRPVRHFAYPYGDRGPREAALARARYRTACGSVSRLLRRGDDRYDLPRLDRHDLRVAARLGLLEGSALSSYLAARRAARRVRRVVERLGGW